MPPDGRMGFHRFPRPLVAAVLAAILGPLLAPARAGAAGDDGGHGLVLVPEPSEFLPLIALFLLLIPLTNALLFKPVFRVLDAREERMDGARRRAARLDLDAAAVVERYRAAVREVRAEAEASRKQTIESARGLQQQRVATERASAERQMESTKREIATALDAARVSLRSDVESLAREAASRVLGRPLS